MRKLFVVAVLACLAVAAAPHRALLPRPQQVRYGSGSLPVNGLAIRFGHAAEASDRFAAGQLSVGLSRVGQTFIPVWESATSGPAIILIRSGNGSPLPLTDETAGPDSRESYTLSITPSGAQIRARSSAGLYYGVQTLLQMVEGTGGQAALPVAEIRDWPSLPYRGFMMDLGHGQLLHVSEIKRQIDHLARFKANQYYFYSEATIELDGYSIVNPDGRYTRDEIRDVIDYARERHVDVVPCLELYGHLHDVFRMEKFADLALPRYGREFDPRNPHVMEVLTDLMDQTARLFPSPWYHVGFDEPWALGKIGMTPGQDPFKAYMGLMGKVAEHAHQYGKRMLFWADVITGGKIFSNHPDLVTEIPKGSIAVPWDYDARADFAPEVEPLASKNIPTVVAPGVWNWNEVFPDYHRTVKNINGFVATGRKYNSLGILNTGWTDSGETIYRMSLPGLAMGAVAGWQTDPVDGATFFGQYARQVYPEAVAEDVAPALEDLSSAEEVLEKVLGGPTILRFWDDPLEPARLERMEGHREELRKARLLAESADEKLQRALHKQGDPATLNSLVLAARMFDYLGMKNLYAIEWARYFRELKQDFKPELASLYLVNQISVIDHGMISDLLDSITGLRQGYRTAWLEESTPYRLGTALSRWDAEAEYWRALQVRAGQIRRNGPPPSLDSLRPKQ
jgi:hypothetical protein